MSATLELPIEIYGRLKKKKVEDKHSNWLWIGFSDQGRSHVALLGGHGPSIILNFLHIIYNKKI